MCSTSRKAIEMERRENESSRDCHTELSADLSFGGRWGCGCLARALSEIHPSSPLSLLFLSSPSSLSLPFTDSSLFNSSTSPPGQTQHNDQDQDHSQDRRSLYKMSQMARHPCHEKQSGPSSPRSIQGSCQVTRERTARRAIWKRNGRYTDGNAFLPITNRTMTTNPTIASSI